MQSAGAEATIAAVLFGWDGRKCLAINVEGEISSAGRRREHFLLAPFTNSHKSSPCMKPN